MPTKAKRPNSTKPHTALVRRPGFLVRRLHQIFVAMYLQNCERFGTTPAQSSIMQVLDAQPGIDQAALAGEIGLDRTTTSNVLSRLETRGIVTRELDDSDRRTKRTYLTPHGKSLLNEMQQSINAAHSQLLGPLDRAEREQFLALLLRLVQENNDKGRSALKGFS
jgi:MarR family transcriptional regulator, lower aerobic nicotinate degradation pathway regulator